MKKEMRLNIMIILIVICLAMLTACMKGAPDDAYMIDLTDERNVVINDAIVFGLTEILKRTNYSNNLFLRNLMIVSTRTSRISGESTTMIRKLQLKPPNTS